MDREKYNQQLDMQSEIYKARIKSHVNKQSPVIQYLWNTDGGQLNKDVKEWEKKNGVKEEW